MYIYVSESEVDWPLWDSNPDLMKSLDLEPNALPSGPQTQTGVMESDVLVLSANISSLGY